MGGDEEDIISDINAKIDVEVGFDSLKMEYYFKEFHDNLI